LLIGIGFEANIVLGDKNYYNPILLNYWGTSDLSYWGAEQFGISEEALYARIIDEGLDEVKDWMIPMLENLEPGLFDASYTLTSVNLGLPLSVSYKRIHLYVFPLLMIPTTSTRFYEQDVQFIISLGMAVAIF